MSAYLKFFELEQSPFEGTDQSKVVLGTKALREAFSTIQTGLDEGASRIFLAGGPGVGKTSFARALPKLLGDETRVAGIADPSMPWESMRAGLAMQWGLGERGLARASLVEAAEDHRLLLVVDQAERATEDFLDHLDVLLSYRDEFADPVVQSVLLGQLRGNASESPPPLLWWLDRIQTLQLEYAPLPREGVAPYIRKHLKRAGWRGGRLFTEDAALAIHGWTGGIPAAVSTLCERLLVSAAECGIESIDASFVDLYSEDNEKSECGEEPWNFDHAFDEGEDEGAPTEDLGTAHKADLDHSGEEEEERIASQKVALPTQPARGQNVTESLPRIETTLEHFETIELLDEARGAELAGELSPPLATQNGETETDYLDLAQGFDPDAETDRETYAELEALEQALSAPPSSSELREIRGSFFAQHAKPLILSALAAVIGGLGFAFFFTQPALDNTGGQKADTPSMLGRVNGPADGMPPEPEAILQLPNNAQSETLLGASQPQNPSDSSSSDDLLARVGPRLQRANEASASSLTSLKSGKTRTQRQIEAEESEQVFEDLRPPGLNGLDDDPIDLSENRNR